MILLGVRYGYVQRRQEDIDPTKCLLKVPLIYFDMLIDEAIPFTCMYVDTAIPGILLQTQYWPVSRSQHVFFKEKSECISTF